MVFADASLYVASTRILRIQGKKIFECPAISDPCTLFMDQSGQASHPDQYNLAPRTPPSMESYASYAARLYF